MNAVRSLPFVFSHYTSNINSNDVVYTRDNIHGLLRLEKKSLHVQWRLTRNVERYGSGVVTNSDSTHFPMREHELPISKLSEVRIQRTRFQIPPRRMLIIVASDMQVFNPLVDDGDLPGLILAHPAELKIAVRRQDHQLLEDFASHMRTTISEIYLDLIDKELKQLGGTGKKSLPPTSQSEDSRTSD